MSRAARHALFWTGGIVLFGTALYLVRGILLPFVVGMAVAYLLDPAADVLERWRVSRGLAAAVILALFFLVVVAALVVLVPLLEDQFVKLLEAVPRVLAWLQAKLAPVVERISAGLAGRELADLRGAAGDYAARLLGWLGRVVSGLWSGGLAVVNLLSLVIVTPIVAFYLLRDWDRLIARIDRWLPRDHASVIREQAREIDRILAAYVRGVTTVVLVLAVFYGAALSLIGLDYGLVIGIGAGLISFIPYIGAILGFVVGTGLALFQFETWLPVLLVAGTFVAGQAIEGNFLTPRIVGGRIGLHPVWVLFALFAGGLLFGFVGILLAVPVAAAAGVLSRFALDRYLQSPFYLGHGGGGPPGGPSASGGPGGEAEPR